MTCPLAPLPPGDGHPRLAGGRASRCLVDALLRLTPSPQASFTRACEPCGRRWERPPRTGPLPPLPPSPIDAPPRLLPSPQASPSRDSEPGHGRATTPHRISAHPSRTLPTASLAPSQTLSPSSSLLPSTSRSAAPRLRRALSPSTRPLIPSALALALPLLLLSLATGAQSLPPFERPNPTVVFPTAGVKTVTLTVCNPAGCSTTSRQLTVLSPFPAITRFLVAPLLPEAGQSLLLDAAGTGEPPLSFAWQLLRGAAPVATRATPSALLPTTGIAPGTYTLQLQLTNAWGSVSTSQPLLLRPDPGPTRFFTIPLCRLLDTRGGPPLTSGVPRAIPVTGTCGIPTTARALAANITVLTPTAAGYLSLFPSDYPRPLTSTVNLVPGLTRSNFAILPLSASGSPSLTAQLSLGRPGHPGTAHLLLDTPGYFAPVAPPTPTSLLFQARLCAFGFCEQAAGTPLFFSQEFSAPASSYSYDWTGSGTFDPPSPVPVTSHTYTVPGFYIPVLRTGSGASARTLVHPMPLIIVPPDPPNRPAPPASPNFRFAGIAAASPVDPTLPGPLDTYLLTVSAPPPNLLGYNLYLSRDGALFTLAAALDPSLPPATPLALRPFGPTDTVLARVTALSVAGESAPSVPLLLPHPPSSTLAAHAAAPPSHRGRALPSVRASRPFETPSIPPGPDQGPRTPPWRALMSRLPAAASPAAAGESAPSLPIHLPHP